MKKKVGVLTVHSGFNEGAILQAFCLSKLLSEQLSSCDVDIVDHRYISKIKVYGEPKNKRKKALDNFINNSLPLSPQRFVEDTHVKTFKYIKNNYNAVIIGSDEVWRVNYTHSKKWFWPFYNQKCLWSPAFPNAFWPDISIKIPKIAYAACVGQTDWTLIPKKHKRMMIRNLFDFSLLGVRDQRTISFLEWLDNDLAKRAELVPDPAFSIDVLGLVDKAQIKCKLEELGLDFSRQRVGIVAYNNSGTNELIKYFKQREFQTVGVSLSNDALDVDLSKEYFNPLEWFSIFGFLDICVSILMHPSIACIANGTPFFGIDVRTSSRDGESKMKDLMRSFNLMEFYYTNQVAFLKRIDQIFKDNILKEWPYSYIKEKRKIFTNQSKEFVNKIKLVISEHE